jgi:hypothetical protein
MSIPDGLGGYGWAAQSTVGQESPQLLELALRP